MRLVSIVGARPQFIKLAPISQAAGSRSIDHIVVHTGQHYDAAMSSSHFNAFALPEPQLNLNIGSGAHGEQTGQALVAIEQALVELAPDWVLVYGDTNSTLAAAIAAIKVQIPVAHLEAGLRSYNRGMPEEHNRVLTDHASDLLLAPTETAVSNLVREGLGGRTVLVGDVMADVCLATARELPADLDASQAESGDPYLLATIHRPYNTDNPERLAEILTQLAASRVPVVLPAHPRLVARAREYGLTLDAGAITITEPLDYPKLISTTLRAQSVITDSGGLQKEAYILGVPCTTVRSETEWVETLEDGWNVLCFEDLTNLIQLALRSKPETPRRNVFGDGHSAEAVVDLLMNR